MRSTTPTRAAPGDTNMVRNVWVSALKQAGVAGGIWQDQAPRNTSNARELRKLCLTLIEEENMPCLWLLVLCQSCSCCRVVWGWHHSQEGALAAPEFRPWPRLTSLLCLPVVWEENILLVASGCVACPSVGLFGGAPAAVLGRSPSCGSDRPEIGAVPHSSGTGRCGKSSRARSAPGQLLPVPSVTTQPVLESAGCGS